MPRVRDFSELRLNIGNGVSVSGEVALAQLRQHAAENCVTSICFEYGGCGDDGTIEYLGFHGPDNTLRLKIGQVVVNVGGVEMTVAELAKQFAWSVISRHDSGFEVGHGNAGEITLFFEKEDAYYTATAIERGVFS